MRLALGYMILVVTVLWAVFRNHRWALFGMIVCDNLRPGEEYVGFGMETIRFSFTYYAVALGLLLIFYRRYRLTDDRFHWSVLLMFLSVVNSALHAPCYGPAVFQVDVYFKMLMQYYLICAFIRDERESRELYWTLGLTMVVVSIRFLWAKFVTFEPDFEGATGDRNEMAMACVMAMPFMAILGLTAKNVLYRIFAWGTLVPLVLCIGFSLSRGGMLGFLGVAGYLLYRLHHKRWLVVLGVVVALVGLVNLPVEIVQRFATIGTATHQDASAMGRLNAWDAARNMVRDRPLTGVGSGNFLVWFRRYAPDPNNIHVAHSSFFQLLGEQGYPGVAIWLWLVIMCWMVASWVEVRLVRLDRGTWSNARYYVVMLKASWLGYVLCGAFLSQEDMDFFYHLVAITSRFTVFVKRREDDVRDEQRNALQAQANKPLEMPAVLNPVS